MTLDDIIERIQHDAAAHTTSGPSDAIEIASLEQAVGQALAPSLRVFLERVGGGIFYGRHEIFGGHRVMIHDIELVPSLRSVAADLRRRRPAPPDGWLPFHRVDGSLHLIDSTGAVVSWPPRAKHVSLEAFFEQVVLSPAG